MASSTTAAAEYPDKPIRIIVPVTPGGGSDLLARLIGQQLGDRFAQPFIVDNRAGAGGTIGSELAAKAVPDGYTLIVAYTASHGINPAIKKLPYDVIDDFAPISMLGTAPNLLVVHPGVPAKSVSELIQLLKSRTVQVNYASAGNGSAPHLAAEMFKYMAAVDMTHIPYKGAAPGVTDLLGGQVSVMFPSMPAALAYARSGRLRALAVTSKTRASAAPELPTVAEAGLPGFDVIQWYALLAPARTPRSIIDKLNAETNRMFKLPDVRQKLAAQGLESSSSSPAEVSAFMRGEVAKWTRFIRDTGLKLD
jgi:tripartite-type tricarboxylate transporter receptor subunit TctC